MIRPEQCAFVTTSSLEEFLADAADHSSFTPFAITESERVAGFISIGYLPENPAHWWIPLLLIDYRQQGKGCGRAAMEAAIAYVRASAPTAVALGLGCHPGNTAALALYRSLGFEEHGLDHGEVQLWLPLHRIRSVIDHSAVW